MTPDQLERGAALLEAIKVIKLDCPRDDDHCRYFAVREKHISADAFMALREAYKAELDAKVAALEAEFEAL